MFDQLYNTEFIGIYCNDPTQYVVTPNLCKFELGCDKNAYSSLGPIYLFQNVYDILANTQVANKN